MINALARLLGIRPDQTEDALRSERAARATLNRRGFLFAGATAAAALTAGSLFSFPPVQRFAGSSLTTFDKLLKQIYAASATKPDMLFMHPRDFAALGGVLSEPDDTSPEIITDPHCPPGRVFMMKAPLPSLVPRGNGLFEVAR